MIEELIKGRKDLWLAVEKKPRGESLEVTFRIKGATPCVLHWAFAPSDHGPWQAPPKPLWPAGTNARGSAAVQTPFESGNGEQRLTFILNPDVPAPFLVFDLFCPETNRWENNRGRDFYLPLSEIKPPPPNPVEALQRETESAEVIRRNELPLDTSERLAAAVVRQGNLLKTILLTDAAGPIVLRWGLGDRASSKWQLPHEVLWPEGTVACDDVAVESPFAESDGLRRLELSFPEADAPPGIAFVLHQTEGDRWLKHRGGNLHLALAERKKRGGPLPPMAEEIIEGEMGHHGWTLMHRFNLCHELLDDARGQREGWALLFVWLRFSAIRQLDWQRNYNTKPRELSHAQDRLTHKLAESFIREPDQRDLIRLMFTCVGRGGEGQRIRDEILQIMHRHHIKEVGGTWMEQWHQKLHNNTTPDDVVICEAYLEFLRHDGNLNSYYETLTAHGVTRDRLAGFERPITNEPEWHPHLKDGLIHDFENYLKLLRSVHSGTDLDTAVNTGRHLLDGAARDALEFVRGNFGNTGLPATELGWKITEARRGLIDALQREGDAGRVKDGLYLDLALEEALRTVIERQVHSGFKGEQLLELTGLVLENLLLTHDDSELRQCRREWQRLPSEDRFSHDWALHAKATLDRLRRAAESIIDRTYQLLQPKAEALGREFQADEWAVRLFSEEVVRGRPIFVLSMLLHHLDPILRKSAKLGDWQVISPSHVTGEVQVIESLRAMQGKRLDRPTVLVAEKVFGDEEPPDGVRAVITPSSVDLVSHVAVRARNASLLFATCFDRAAFERLQKMNGRVVELKVSAAGDVLVAEATGELDATAISAAPPPEKTSRPKPCLRALRMRDFETSLVGGKSWHLKELSEKLPDWIQTPKSVALPFGVFDAVLEDKANAKVARRYRELIEQLTEQPQATLAGIRRCLLELRIPDELVTELRRAMKAENLPWPEEFDTAARRIKEVWASKWNDRAYFSREARRWPHDAVSMAVLIQEVVEADYAFVIHTVNPFTSERGEQYAEVVLGLGETLVGNHPGRAFSFVSSKSKPHHTVLAYPGKSIALKGGGLIFRSDSNAEDLAGYAGAGLYESVLLEPAREVIADYSNEPLVWDATAREQIMQQIAKAGLEIEKAFGAPQDIEGAIAGDRLYVVQTRPQVGLKDESTH